MNQNKICKICGKHFNENELIAGHGINHKIEKLIKVDFPDWTDYDLICKDDLENYRTKYIKSIIEDEKGELKNLEKEVLKSIKDNDLISSNINVSFSEKRTLPDKISDKIANFGGSWTFIISFFGVLMFWIFLNSAFLFLHPFDPYPFILLNLILSCIAAIQAPIIMMSQNRQEKKDRIRSESDYKINLKSELEIRTLHEKVDHLLLIQWAKLIEIQDFQVEILEEIKNELKIREQK